MSQRNAVYPATVLQSRDPRGLGRLQVSVPAFDQKVWARRATLLAGERRGRQRAQRAAGPCGGGVPARSARRPRPSARAQHLRPLSSPGAARP